MKSAYEDKEKLIGQLFMGGAGCFVVGLFFGFIGLVLQAGLLLAFGVLIVVGAVALVGGGLFLGYQHNQSMSTAAPRPQEEGRVVARFAINDIGEMIFDNFEYDAEEARFYVRIQYLGGKREELECARPVFDLCGEGMRGLLTIQGSWLAQFVPLMDTDATKAAYRES